MNSKPHRQAVIETDLNNLSREELIQLIITQHHSKQTYNKIVIADFMVETSEPINICEETINRLIDRNKDFFTSRKAMVQLEGSGFNSVGIG